jgi:hypothetical protein
MDTRLRSEEKETADPVCILWNLRSQGKCMQKEEE